MTTYHEFDHDGKHYRFVYDEDYRPESSGCPEFGEIDLANEIEKLDSGDWVALGCIVTAPCLDESGHHHCQSCTGRKEVDSLWGIVIENSAQEAEEFAKECM
jgi:hypothetical protein